MISVTVMFVGFVVALICSAIRPTLQRGEALFDALTIIGFIMFALGLLHVLAGK